MALQDGQRSEGRSFPRWTFASIGRSIGISPSQVFRSMERAVEAGIVRRDGTIKPKSLLEALVAAPHYLPAKLGAITRGIPTAYTAPPLSAVIAPSEEPPPVWPYADGSERGQALEPIYKTVPIAALQDARLYEYLALVDALRSGRARETALARAELERRLGITQ